jgi:2-polyprenyl-3-methyl-5-hydroxy-6-metoxy-1,4-benzoquinol methylase
MKKQMRQIQIAAKKKLSRFISVVFRRNKFVNRRIFTRIYKNDLFNKWVDNANNVSKSGSGSDLVQTREVIRQLPGLLQKYGVKTMLDVPCGDFYWMQNVKLQGVDYTGADIVKQIIKINNAKFSSPGLRFCVLDVLNDPVPQVDLIFCRDLLVHLQLDQIKLILENFKNSGSRFLLTTSFTNTTQNRDNGVIGFWRPINLSVAPFNMGQPLDVIFENCTEKDGAYNDKHLFLYQLNP